MSSNIDENEILNRIEKERYLISCKCTICNTPFKDIMLGTLHITDKHPKRKVRNVIENLSWDVKEDLKKWEILQELKESRETIIQKLTDENTIAQAEVPDVVEIQRKKANISEIMKALQDDLRMAEKKPEKEEAEVEVAEEEIEEIEEEIDEKDFEDSEEEINEEEDSTERSEEGEIDKVDEEEGGIEKEDESQKSTSLKKSKKRNLCDLLERELEKYIDSIKRLPMASQVEQFSKSRNKDQVKLYKYAEQVDYFLGVAKAIKIIKDSKQDFEIII